MFCWNHLLHRKPVVRFHRDSSSVSADLSEKYLTRLTAILTNHSRTPDGIHWCQLLELCSLCLQFRTIREGIFLLDKLQHLLGIQLQSYDWLLVVGFLLPVLSEQSLCCSAERTVHATDTNLFPGNVRRRFCNCKEIKESHAAIKHCYI